MPTRRSRFGDLHGSVINYVRLSVKTLKGVYYLRDLEISKISYKEISKLLKKIN